MRRPLRSSDVVGAAVTLVLICLLGASCSSSESLDPDQRVEAAAILDQRVAEAMIQLSDDDRECAIDRLQPADLDDLSAAVPRLEPAAAAVVDCVGVELIGSSVLQSQTGAISQESLDCAVGELDREFVIALVAGAMDDRPPQARAEIEVARALGVCLELGELLDQ